MKFLRLIICLILCACSVFTFSVGKNKISKNAVTENKIEYRGILTLWQIDGFEGGSGSRRQFLMEIAREFEKKNTGVLIMVTNHTKTSAEQSMSEGNYPDLISYSNGLKAQNLTRLSGLRYNFNGGCVDKNSYATPWCRGGYVIIRNPLLGEWDNSALDNAVISQNEYTQPLTALALDGYKLNKYTIEQPMDAYVRFVAGKTKYLIGTQRDIVRLTNRGMNFDCKPLKNYNDLYQYISVTATQHDKIVLCNEFINLLISESVQKSLNKINMLSVFDKVDNEIEALNLMQEYESQYSLSPFISVNQYEQMQSLGVKWANGDENAIFKIKNVVLYLEKLR